MNYPSVFTRYMALTGVLALLLLPAISNAQGSFRKSKDGSIKGALEFLPNGRLADGFQRAASHFPDHKDPMVDPYKWIERDGIRMRGLVKDAVLFMQWWTLLGDPAERYSFKWITSGYYEIQYEEKGQMVTKYITRSQLTKYPDLLKKFDRIEPYNVNVEITFNSGDIDDKAYYDFRKKNNILTDLGSAGYKSGPFTIVSNGVHYLFAPSNQDPPFVLPTMKVGGWKEFLSLPKDMSESKVKSTIELFRLGRVLKIHSFRITDLQWPLGTLREIARQYERYEKKEDTPKEVAAKGELEQQADGGDDFWNEAEVVNMEMEVYRDQTNYKYGLKAKNGLRALPAIYRQLEPSSQKGIFLGTTGDDYVVAVNSLGKEVARQKGYIQQGKVVEETSKDEFGCLSYYTTMYSLYSFSGGAFKLETNRLFKLAYGGSWSGAIIVRDASQPVDYEAERRAKEEEDRRRDECYSRIRAKRSSLISSGYIDIEKYFK